MTNQQLGDQSMGDQNMDNQIRDNQIMDKRKKEIATKKYTIREASRRTGLSISALRYYDKEGLIPQLERSASGIRMYGEGDMAWLELICCLKNSGMSIEKIKGFMLACLGGISTAAERKALLEEHKASILVQMKVLENSLDIVNYKLEHYMEIGTG